jgi:hypothetical protein
MVVIQNRIKARLFFYDPQGTLYEEIVEVPSAPCAGMCEEDKISYLSNNHLIEFIFDHIDAGVEILED